MDGTLILENSWDMLYQQLGLGTSPWLEDYASGKINYRKLFELDINHWIIKKGPISRSFVQSVAKRVTIAPDAKEAFKWFHENGIKTVIITAGLREFAERVMSELEVYEAYYNELIYEEDGLCRGGFIDRVDPLRKWEIVERVLKRDGVIREESFSVGDTQYDESMFRSTGTAFILDGPNGSGVKGAIKVKSLLEVRDYVMQL